MVLGCRQLDPELPLAGVVLNDVATSRQERVVREAVEASTGLPVLGAVPRLQSDDPLPGRHLGLVTVGEHPRSGQAIETAAAVVEEHLELERVLEIARSATQTTLPLLELEGDSGACRIGYFSGPAFSFYYTENLDDLRRRGAQLVPVNPHGDARLPAIDGLYIGGGFPEVYAERLADNRQLAEDLRRRVAVGLPVYAECGGLMYLARELVVEGSSYPMAGVLDLVVEQTAKPQGHGYEIGVVDRTNPFFPSGCELRGHEFHYSRVVGGDDLRYTVVDLSRGVGIDHRRDGLVSGRVWASYLHVHALATPGWSSGFLSLARKHAHSSVGSAVAWA
jgi:cobyrinic acid a,c-diamide synthase